MSRFGAQVVTIGDKTRLIVSCLKSDGESFYTALEIPTAEFSEKTASVVAGWLKQRAVPELLKQP